jgi:hypothetical protein
MALVVPDLESALVLLREEDVRIARADEDMVVIDPGETGGVEVALADRLLPGDPRA